MSKQMQPSSNNIDQIRSLIFGQQMEEYQDRFNTLSQEVSNLRDEMRSSFTRIEKMIEQLNANTDQQNTDVHSRLDDTKKQLEDSLAATELRLTESIRQLDHDSAKRLQLAAFLENVSQQLRNGDTAETNHKPAQKEQHE
ncbi:MAG: hypothetical protein R3C26_19430 [Calditrichia bacterium]|nr:hypothetical protein [Calditrichia bacterium]